MKRIIFLVIACALSNIVVKAQESLVKEENTDTTAVFNRVVHDFKTVSESGGLIECEFTLTNTGDNPLVITKVTTSCGCTASDWTKEPIGAGKQGFVKVSFDPKGRKGEFVKSLTVFTNGNPSSLRLKIKGNIE
ncbi:MAG: DUF1573 domain-containing protein [Tannerella sp.]|jgi:hypothetical protein|nr:DUF1573 domain-containing protein [Tannerella sp.]